jgi:hypothetical protein
MILLNTKAEAAAFLSCGKSDKALGPVHAILVHPAIYIAVI